MTDNKQAPLNPVWKAIKPFVNGGLSGMGATCIIQPVDMVKVRLQLGDKGSPLAVARRLAAQEGVGALYRGLSAGLVRQATYTTARLGLYNYIDGFAKKLNDNKVREGVQGGWSHSYWRMCADTMWCEELAK